MVFEIKHSEPDDILYFYTSLIPAKRKGKNVSEYVDSLDAAASEANFPVQYRDCTIIFVCHYACAATRYIDNDNLSIKLITDVLQRHYLVSDNSSLVTTVCISEPSLDGREYSEIYIVPFRLSKKSILNYVRSDSNEYN